MAGLIHDPEIACPICSKVHSDVQGCVRKEPFISKWAFVLGGIVFLCFFALAVGVALGEFPFLARTGGAGMCLVMGWFAASAIIYIPAFLRRHK